jgi:CRP-like cAMP-binding protein
MASDALLATAPPRGPINLKLSPVLSQGFDEASLVLDLKNGTRAIRSGYELISEGRRCGSVFVLLEGVAIRYRVLRDGQRQILNILLPGDFAGIPSCFFGNALYSIRTLTPALVLPMPMPRLVSLFETHPRIAAKLFWAFACESAIYAERLVSVSRRSATERVAHFLLELLTRLKNLGLAERQSFRLPLTQEILSDALGLSIPYVNRVLQQLRAEGLVRIKDHEVIVDDMDEFAALADFEPTYLTPLSINDFTGEIT